MEPTVAKDEAKSLACSGSLGRWWADGAAPHEEAWRRFAEGRPLRGATPRCLAWACERLAAAGKAALLLVWDNAAWPVSRAVRAGIAAHTRRAKATGHGARIVEGRLPTTSPRRNPLAPNWTHGKRRVVEPARLLPVEEQEDRVYAALGAEHTEHLIPDQVV